MCKAFWSEELHLYSIFLTLKQNIMGNLLYTIAVILIVIWALGFFAYNVGSVIHILLVIAIVAVLFRVIRGGS